MDLEKDKSSFRLDSKARTFRPYDFGLGDLPWIVLGFPIVMVLVAGGSYFFEQGAAILSPNVRNTMLGFVLGFFAGVRVCDWFSRRSRPRTPLE